MMSFTGKNDESPNSGDEVGDSSRMNTLVFSKSDSGTDSGNLKLTIMLPEF